MSISVRQIEERKMRQDSILTGALEVFKTKGLENATMEEIADQSCFGKATLYYYFQSKEEVFSCILENGWKMLWSNLKPIITANSSPRQMFVHILLKTSETIRSRPGLFEFLFNVPQKITFKKQPWKEHQDHLYATLIDLLEEGIKAKEFPNLNSKLLFRAIGGFFMGTVLMGDKNDPVSEEDIEELLNQLIIHPKQ